MAEIVGSSAQESGVNSPPTDVNSGDSESLTSTASHLDRSLASAMAWMTVVRTVAQAVTWVVSITVARLLTPDDYGLVEMGAVYLGALMIIAEFGLGRAVVAHRHLSDVQIAGLNSIALILGATSFVIGALSAVPISAFFRTPELLVVVPVLSVNFLLLALRTVPQARLQRELRFREIALVELSQSLVQAGTALALALLGFGYWALVGSILAGGFAHTTLMLLRRPTPFAKPDLRATARTLQLSRQVLGSELAWYTFQNADFVVVGRMLGQTALGSYTMGWHLALLPLEKISSVTVHVTPSIFAAAKASHELVRRYLLALTRGLLIVTLPATIGIALVAPDLVTAMLGDRWVGSTAPLRFLAVYAALRSLDPMWTQLLMVTDDASYAMRRNVTAAIVLPIAFLVGSRWGTVGVAISWILVHPFVIVLPLFLRVSKRFEFPVRQHLAAMAPPALCTAIMAALVILARSYAFSDLSPLQRLLLSAATGGSAYVLSFVLLFRTQLMDAIRSLQLLRQKE